MSWRFMREICNLDYRVPHAVLLFATREYSRERQEHVCLYLLAHNCKCLYLAGPYAYEWYRACELANRKAYPDDVFSRIVLFGSPAESDLPYPQLMERFHYAADHVHSEPVEKYYLIFEEKDGLPDCFMRQPAEENRNMDITNEILNGWAIYPK